MGGKRETASSTGAGSRTHSREMGKRKRKAWLLAEVRTAERESGGTTRGIMLEKSEASSKRGDLPGKKTGAG